MGNIQRIGSLAMVAVVATSCGGGVVVSEAERQALADYEAAAVDSASALDGLGAAADALAMHLEASAADATIDADVDALERRITALETSAEDLEDAEAMLQRATYGDAPGVHREALVSAVLYVLGVAAFAVTMRALSDRMIAARTRRDEALARDDTAAYADAQSEMADVGAQAIRNVVTKVLPNPVQSAVSLVPGGQLVITAKNTIDDVTTLAATDACRVDADSDECRFGATTADSETVLEVPAGTLQVTVTGPGLARAVVDDVDIAEGERVTLEVDLPARADLPGESAGGIQHCYGTFGCFDGTSDWLPGECRSEGGTPMPGPCP